jgi:hypothetical protein
MKKNLRSLYGIVQSHCPAGVLFSVMGDAEEGPAGPSFPLAVRQRTD